MSILEKQSYSTIYLNFGDRCIKLPNGIDVPTIGEV